MDALKRLLTEDWTDACAKAAATCDIEKSTDWVVALLTQLMGRPASLNPHYLRLGSAPFNFPTTDGLCPEIPILEGDSHV